MCFFLACHSDSSYVQFFGDDFLRTLILRFVFCDVVLRIHRAFRGRHQRPRCEPPLPTAELLEHSSLTHIVLQLATALEVRRHFSEETEGDWLNGKTYWTIYCKIVLFDRTSERNGSNLEFYVSIELVIYNFLGWKMVWVESGL